MKFSESHEWIKATDGIGTVGITNFAQKELGEIVHVELPKVGDHVEVGQEVAVVESTKAAVDICSPASGVIEEINPAIVENPSLINKDPQIEGWLFKIKLSKVNELEDLLDHVQYLALMR
ncbi:MAG: glycine cleavage system protein GcvH [Candidatus Algichlamydia australiensis]|nr:glycine cleavage system protein GcvH [Chlamydiales bacterium]